jgi:hypothetical protein
MLVIALLAGSLASADRTGDRRPKGPSTGTGH